MTWRWLTAASRRRSIKGKSSGTAAGTELRDEGTARFALWRVRRIWPRYGEPTVFELAASYAYGIARNHPFVDGNKRTAFVASVLFLHMNGQRLHAVQAEAAVVFLRLAAGEFSEAELAEWFRRNASPPDEAFLVPEQDQ